jgi:hypothetical protein
VHLSVAPLSSVGKQGTRAHDFAIGAECGLGVCRGPCGFRLDHSVNEELEDGM